MIIVGDVLVPEDLKSKQYFCCNLQKCKGACCVLGDAGAPLEPEEIEEIQNALPKIRPFMQKVAAEAINEDNLFDYDHEGNLVTALIHDKECVFAFFEGGIAFCAIEKAFLQKQITFRKPISCHLYPIRITKDGAFKKLTYHKWDICHDAVELGRNQKILLIDYIREPLKRKFGREWMIMLHDALKRKV